MSSILLAAFQLGFVYALLPGPIFIGSSQCVVSGGWRQGSWFVIGATLADFIYITLLHWGLSNLLIDNLFINLILGVLGGGWLIKLGIDAIRIPFEDHDGSKAGHMPERCRTALTGGFVVNLFNPLSIVGWVALGANIVVLWKPQEAMLEADSLLVLLTFLAGKKVWQFLVVGIISGVRQQLRWRWLKSLSHIGGASLILCGIATWFSVVL